MADQNFSTMWNGILCIMDGTIMPNFAQYRISSFHLETSTAQI
jgi:hypothetical protein